MKEELIAWSKHFRESFDKIILIILVTGFIFLVLHIAHDKLDELISDWARGRADEVLGALVGIVTGYKMGQIAEIKNKENKEKDNA